MIVRVDDLPSGKDADPNTVIPNWFEAFQQFHACMGGVPYTLGVVPKWVKPVDLAWLRSQPTITIACHGITHARGEFDQPEHYIIEGLRKADAVVHTDVFIPPFNYLNYNLLRALSAVGYRYVTTGPETDPRVLGAAGPITVVPSAWYGRAREFLAAIEYKGEWLHPWDCMTLHWTWEWSEGFVPLRELMSAVSCSVVPWHEGLARKATS